MVLVNMIKKLTRFIVNRTADFGAFDFPFLLSRKGAILLIVIVGGFGPMKVGESFLKCTRLQIC